MLHGTDDPLEGTLALARAILIDGVAAAGSPIESALAAAAAELDGLAHGGLGHDPSVNRVREAAARLEGVGLGEAAARLRALGAELGKTAEGQGGDGAAAAWVAAAIRVALSVETIAA